MKKEGKKFGWELAMKNLDDLNTLFKIEKGKIVAWYCHDSGEWIRTGSNASAALSYRSPSSRKSDSRAIGPIHLYIENLSRRS
jgi:hypothetical protein